jgi:peptidoglycan hydrolase-like protein with peptidoglycan-binding domain
MPSFLHAVTLTMCAVVAAAISVPLAGAAPAEDTSNTPIPAQIAPVAPAGEVTDAADSTRTAGAERPQPRAGETLTISTTDATPLFGQDVTLAGRYSPAAATAYVLERRTSTGWTTIHSGTTQADGTWSRTFEPAYTMTVRARATNNTATSPTRTLVVRPRLVIQSIGTAPAFVGVRVSARVFPPTYRGKIAFSTRYAGRVRARVVKRPVNGNLVVTVPNNGVGKLPVDVTLSRTSTLAQGRQRIHVLAPIRMLRSGSQGPDVAAVVRRLQALNFLTPGTPARYDHRVADVVLAFRKSRGMDRRSIVDAATWRALAVAQPLRPRHAGPARHIEVDKTRQIMMVVRNGRVIGAMHVSTGASGNTPEGRWRIYQKGGSYLYKFMAFVGNYGIHGYVPVPTFPASHGCVREPIWAAAWTFRVTDYGDTVIVYR